MKKNLGLLLGMAMIDVMMTGQKEYATNDGSIGHGIPDVKKEIIPNGCDRYNFYGFQVIALNEKSARKKCEKLYIKKYGRKP